MFSDPEPGSNGNFLGFGLPVLNDAGDVAFNAVLNGTSAGFLDDREIYSWKKPSLDTVARMSFPTPEGNGVFDFVGVPLINNSGKSLFFQRFAKQLGDPQTIAGFIVQIRMVH